MYGYYNRYVCTREHLFICMRVFARFYGCGNGCFKVDISIPIQAELFMIYRRLLTLYICSIVMCLDISSLSLSLFNIHAYIYTRTNVYVRLYFILYISFSMCISRAGNDEPTRHGYGLLIMTP